MDDCSKLNILAKAFDVLQTQSNPWHNGHQGRCSTLCVRFAKALKTSDQYKDTVTEYFVSTLKWGSRLHDIGKATIRDAIINKPGRLTKEEWLSIKAHPANGAEILNALDLRNKDIVDIVLYHQERWDGSGYPKGLKGIEIPLSARILKIVDTLDAMTNERPYRRVYSASQAIAEMTKDAGVALDPTLFKHFLEFMKV